MFPQLFSKKIVTLFIALLGLIIYFSGSAIEQTAPPPPENNLGAVATGIPEKKLLLENGLDANHFLVTRVIDGDTIVIEGVNGIALKTRLIGVNTPETADPRKKVECFGKEASERTKDALLGKVVRIETDSTQEKYDRYGRLLVYIFIENGELFNEMLISDGYAYEYTYRLPYKYQKEFKETESLARNEKRGLWAREACGY